MYGLPNQTEDTWRTSLHAALEYKPEELYLYPLYVRPLTTLGKKQVEAVDAHRVALYEQARDMLRAAGYRQVSLRMFKRAGDVTAPAGDPTSIGPVYCCQADGMIGLGCGARSYTTNVHYSSEWAVGARGVRGIIDRYIARSDEEFAVANYGFVLDEAEQRRRWLILSLLSDEGLDLAAYRARFAAEPDVLGELAEHGWVTRDAETFRLTAEGLARADMIGPYLFTEAVHQRMATYELT
jgi:oxygen-independent coproporphyrinogen-3 oxidase